VDFVDEQDGAPAGAAARLFGLRHHFADFLDAGQHGTERDEVCARRAGDDAGKRGLAGSRRTPQDDRSQAIVVDRFAQGASGRKQCILPDDVVEGARTHALCQRRCWIDRRRFRPGRGRVVIVEQVHQRLARAGGVRRWRDAS
jgi:hypothetical protein